MLPIRCYSCNAPLQEGKPPSDYARICCRRMVMASKSVVEDLLPYGNEECVMDENETRWSSKVEFEREVSCD